MARKCCLSRIASLNVVGKQFSRIRKGPFLRSLLPAAAIRPTSWPESGQWIWSSLRTSDPGTAAAFYQTLFDYEVFDLPSDDGTQHLLLASDNYARATVNALPANRPNAYPHWLNYIRVEDAVKMTAKVVALGGRVLVEPRVDRHGGKVAVVADPSGAHFGLLEWPDTESKQVPK